MVKFVNKFVRSKNEMVTETGVNQYSTVKTKAGDGDVSIMVS